VLQCQGGIRVLVLDECHWSRGRERGRDGPEPPEPPVRMLPCLARCRRRRHRLARGISPLSLAADCATQVLYLLVRPAAAPPQTLNFKIKLRGILCENERNGRPVIRKADTRTAGRTHQVDVINNKTIQTNYQTTRRHFYSDAARCKSSLLLRQGRKQAKSTGAFSKSYRTRTSSRGGRRPCFRKAVQRRPSQPRQILTNFAHSF